VDVGRRGGGGENPAAGGERAAGAGGGGGDNWEYSSNNKYFTTFYVGSDRKIHYCALTIYANNLCYYLYILQLCLHCDHNCNF